MLGIGVVTLFPELVEAVARHGVTGRAAGDGLFSLRCWNPRHYARDRHRSVDDRPFGGGPGMVMQVEPVRRALAAAREALGPDVPAVALSPAGRPVDQALLQRVAAGPGLVLVAGRYEGVDERVLARDVDEEWSLGDFVLSGGELAAMAVIDGVVRLLPGALGHPDSASEDSFTAGLLDCPHYTRPAALPGEAVPEVLLAGDHAAVGRWRRRQAMARTLQRRPDLLVRTPLDLDWQEALVAVLRGEAQAGTGGEGDEHVFSPP